jgi:predicted RNA-binding Zn-ribbon protein involved in translation (DUF1610 family)
MLVRCSPSNPNVSKPAQQLLAMPSQNSRSRRTTSGEQEEIEVPCPNCGNKISRSEYRELIQEAQEDDDGGIPLWVYPILVALLWLASQAIQNPLAF